MIDFTEYTVFFRLFDFSISWWLLKLIDFTEYIGFFFTFRLIELLLGGQIDLY